MAKLQAMRVSFGILFVWLIAFFPGFYPLAKAQECADRLIFTPVSQPNLIEWGKFPDFTLPFPVIYGGPRFMDARPAHYVMDLAIWWTLRTLNMGHLFRRANGHWCIMGLQQV
ncbi:hypothetical protein [Spirosoma telluris]|uniref:hypothetical protein n=1 Tax=Spirosoma telluris TaxID=2183553 RepID=UPI002FC347BE